MPQKRDITKYLFWTVVFFWLTYASLVAVFIGGQQEWAGDVFKDRLDLAKVDRDDAFKQGSGFRRDWAEELTEEELTASQMVRHTDERERDALEDYRAMMDRAPDNYNTTMHYLTRNPIEVFGFLTILGFIISVFFGYWDAFWAKRRK